ncbi:MAG: hypothetical protein QQW96_02340 [Tychonema bourrellyi B0820]|nr:hypothetical protein [Tychonema bourrellyi]MDQ2096479.1 hypothetical protein [Tychonema bourrellyi B0820]
MSRKHPGRSGNPDLRRATQLPGPPIAEIEAQLSRVSSNVGSD